MQHVLRNKNSTIRSSSAQCNIEKEINLHLMLWPGKRQSAAFNPITTIIIYITNVITTIIIYITSIITTVITIITNIITMIIIFGLGIWLTDMSFLYWWFFAVLHHHHDHYLKVIFARTVILIFIMLYFMEVRKIWTNKERLSEEWRQERNQLSVEWEILFLWMNTNPRNVDALPKWN